MDLGLYEFWHNLNSRLTIRRELILYAPFFHLRWEILQVIVLLLLGMRWTHVSWKYMYFVVNKRELKKKWTISIGEDNALLTWHLNVLFWYLRKKKKAMQSKRFSLSMVSYACYFKSVMQNTWPTGFVSQFYIPYKPIEPISHYTQWEKAIRYYLSVCCI